MVDIIIQLFFCNFHNFVQKICENNEKNRHGWKNFTNMSECRYVISLKVLELSRLICYNADVLCSCRTLCGIFQEKNGMHFGTNGSS